MRFWFPPNPKDPNPGACGGVRSVCAPRLLAVPPAACWTLLGFGKEDISGGAFPFA